ncbi:MAG TPA: hypothetical protein VER12_01450 [Polyangiaceae bacterium]|nr:hypothetical protein [Polyangiaceae bacterium]
MSSVSRIFLISSFFCAQSLLACGGSSDGHDSPANAGSAGADAGAGNDADSAGAGHGAGAPAAGRGNTAGAGAGQNPAPSGTKLSEIKTDAQALAVCNRIKDSISDAELKKMLQGSCAIQGQTGAASQLGTCEALQAECAAHTPLPSPNDGSCTAEDIPDCDNVTVDEYVACTHGTMAIGIEYLSGITCQTDLESLETPGTASACAGPFARCPEYAALYQ